MQTPKRIVVPVDFSEHARAACERAFLMAERCNAAVEFLHAHPPVSAALDLDSTHALVDQIRDADLEAFDRFCSGYATQGREFARRFVERDPADAIHSAARDDGASLIVMGSHGRRGLDRLLLGSVAERTLQGAPAPVMIVRDTPESAATPIRSMLLATDFSDDAGRAEEWVGRWAPCLGAEVEVLHAIRETSVLFAPYAVPGSSDFEGEMLEAAHRRMERVLTRLTAAGITAKSKIVYGRAAESIIDRAEATGADLIVIGTRGYSTLRRYLVGSVAQRVARHAPCSVLIAGRSEDD